VLPARGAGAARAQRRPRPAPHLQQRHRLVAERAAHDAAPQRAPAGGVRGHQAGEGHAVRHLAPKRAGAGRVLLLLLLVLLLLLLLMLLLALREPQPRRDGRAGRAGGAAGAAAAAVAAVRGAAVREALEAALPRLVLLYLWGRASKRV
jgi:hypothetical protein